MSEQNCSRWTGGGYAADLWRVHPHVRFWPILLKKSKYRPGPIFSAPWVRFSIAGTGPHRPPSDSSTTTLAYVFILDFGHCRCLAPRRLLRSDLPCAAANFGPA